ncbi:hypothetical protein BACI348_140013 [Bacillus altitudinis]|uniref:Uncharacterized protein n=1 Tax=Bacillus altitudinis TaxID=293387 RepID=A0A653LJ78_BACAB|nr:hypothetical protein BACI348_140013 [Bacillus altitudinis]
MWNSIPIHMYEPSIQGEAIDMMTLAKGGNADESCHLSREKPHCGEGSSCTIYSRS